MAEEITQEGMLSQLPPASAPAPKKRGRPKKVTPQPKAAMPTMNIMPPSSVTAPRIDDDDDDEDEDFDDDAPPVFRAPLPTPPALARNQQLAMHQQHTEEFDALLNSLEFEKGQHSVSVTRVEPEFDPNTGRKISGYLEKYTRAIHLDEIKNKYGGGKYRLIVHGPGFNGKTTVKANRVVEIAGDPIQPMRIQPQQQNGGVPAGVENILKETLASADRQIERAAKETNELKQLLMAQMTKGDNGLTEAILTLANPAKAQEMMIEERRLQEQRLAAEREERRRAEEAAERRHKETLEAQRMQFEMQMRKYELDQQRIREEQKEATERQRQQYELQLRMFERAESEKEARLQKMAEIESERQAKQMIQMQQISQMQMESMRSMGALEREFLTKQLDVVQKQVRNNPIDDLLKTKQLLDTLSGNDEDTPTWKLVADEFKEALPGLLAAAGMLRGGGQQAQPQQVLPNSVAVVDEDDEEPVRQLRRRRRRPRALEAPQAQPAPQPVVQAVPAAPEVANELTEFAYPPEGTDIEQVLVLLVKDIDLALQKDFSAQQILEQVVRKFSPEVAYILQAQDVETLVQTIEERAPSSWRINTLDGQAKVRELYELLKTAQ